MSRRLAYMYDLRSNRFLHKLHRDSDAVLRVAFNPATPELLTGTLGGRLGVFRPSGGPRLSPDPSGAQPGPPHLAAVIAAGCVPPAPSRL
ncbi:unnamed protein product [Boreogadus saida]